MGRAFKARSITLARADYSVRAVGLQVPKGPLLGLTFVIRFSKSFDGELFLPPPAGPLDGGPVDDGGPVATHGRDGFGTRRVFCIFDGATVAVPVRPVSADKGSVGL